MFGEWEVRVYTIPGYGRNRIYMMKRNNLGMQYIDHNGELHGIENGDYNKNIDEWWFAEAGDQQLQAMADTLAKRGVRTTNDSKNEGLLEATQAHLEDMRTLVFKRSK